MIDLAFKLPAEDAPVSGSIRVLSVSLTSQRADDVIEALRDLVGRLPDHPAILPLTDAGVSDGRPFIVTPHITGESLDVALDVYGPAAVDDALPRIRLLAEALDIGAAHGMCHGALSPRDIIVSADDTCVAGLGVTDALARVGLTLPRDPRYTAPEVAADGGRTAAADQYALAIIAHEWMFGHAVAPADGFLAVPSLAGIDAATMQQAFDLAASDDPARRHASCLAFAEALMRGAVAEAVVDAPVSRVPAAVVDELPLQVDDEVPVPDLAEPVGESHESRQGLSALAIAAILILGLMTGAGGVWFLLDARKASLSRSAASQEFTEADVADVPGPQSTEVLDVPVNPPRDDVPPQKVVPQGRNDVAPRDVAARADAAPAAQSDAGLLIHSTPAGAAVAVDGISRGVTPVAVRGLPLGTRTVVVTRPGYRQVERQIALTAERPSRALEVQLLPTPSARAAPVAAAPTVASGSLFVDSRPVGAVVFVDGRRVGVTPLTLSDLAPGRRTVRIEHPGYRPVTTTADVKAGARARVAARLEGGLDEE